MPRSAIKSTHGKVSLRAFDYTRTASLPDCIYSVWNKTTFWKRLSLPLVEGAVVIREERDIHFCINVENPSFFSSSHRSFSWDWHWHKQNWKQLDDTEQCPEACPVRTHDCWQCSFSWLVTSVALRTCVHRDPSLCKHVSAWTRARPITKNKLTQSSKRIANRFMVRSTRQIWKKRIHLADKRSLTYWMCNWRGLSTLLTERSILKPC